jgi:hypothetical protein
LSRDVAQHDLKKSIFVAPCRANIVVADITLIKWTTGTQDQEKGGGGAKAEHGAQDVVDGHLECEPGGHRKL